MKPDSIRIGLDLVGDHWTVLIFRELFMGVGQWTDFEYNLEIPPATLSKRLKNLVETGCLIKTCLNGSRESRYDLTEMGRDLFTFHLASREWQLNWDPRPGIFITPWIHKCGAPLRCRSICGSCAEEITAQEIRLEDRSMASESAKTSRSGHRRSAATSVIDARAKHSLPPKIVALIGNHQSFIAMSALLRDFCRFDEIQEFTQLPPGTLSDRLRKLQLLGMVHCRLYQQRPDRYEYFPSPMGLGLIGLLLELLRWSNRWLQPLDSDRMKAYHLLCGSLMESQIVCRHCAEPVRLEDCRLGDFIGPTESPATGPLHDTRLEG